MGSTRAFASSVCEAPIEFVWREIRDFKFPAKFFDSVVDVELAGNKPSTAVGVSRKLQWVDGSIRIQTLIAISDQSHTVSWESEYSDPPAEYTACLTTLSLHRVTDIDATLLIWSSDFSTDVSSSVVMFEQRAYAQNLHDLSYHLENLYRESKQ
eukprot:TRINITY_DN12162_c0_g1_i1.p1 TRINITY_DN12162_c0_g1~~TRINITY_DN12162_c0_g1_i1.p1  ORF type:complete len:154 (+),score=23.01 TRINITY_DN12162_c0_g1_i1:40-501(+)